MLTSMSGDVPQISILRGDLRERVEMLGTVDWRPILAAKIKEEAGGDKISNDRIDALNTLYATLSSTGKTGNDLANAMYSGTIPGGLDNLWAPRPISNYYSLLQMQSFVKNISPAKKTGDTKKSWFEMVTAYQTPLLIIAGLAVGGYFLSNVRGFIPTTVKVKQ